MNDKTIGSCSHIVKGKTSDQSQLALVCGRQDFHVGWKGDARGFHSILEFSFKGAEGDHVTGPNLTKGPEKTVTMACEPDVPQLPGHRSVRAMAYPSTQDLSRIALKNNSSECKPRYLNLANSFPNCR